MFLIRSELNSSYPNIGDKFGGRDHTTIMHGVDKVDNMLKNSLIKEDILGIPKLNVGKNVDY